ncbi:MAG: hypothetical protein LIP00_03745 [Parabacteroides sp.]|nr:hypothetical protein [Parabacteroides sp.]
MQQFFYGWFFLECKAYLNRLLGVRLPAEAVVFFSRFYSSPRIRIGGDSLLSFIEETAIFPVKKTKRNRKPGKSFFLLYFGGK